MKNNRRDWLIQMRKRQGYTQAQLAEEAGIAQSTYAGIETGANEPGRKAAKRIAAVLMFDWTMFYRDTAA